MEFLTDFADQAVILPLMAIAALGLALGGWPRGALAWLLVCAATLAAVAVAKLASFVLGPPSMLPLLLSPSGHVASALLIYGGLFYVLLPGRSARLAALPLSLTVGALIAFTRLALGGHTVADVAVGAAIGLMGAVALRTALGAPPAHFRRLPVLLLIGAALAGFHGLRLPAEPWLWDLAGLLTPQ